MLDLHPPHIFQIDGNLGGTAAVLEMLLQNYHGELHFLPALPTAWPNGSVSDLRTRGGITIGMAWRAGKLRQASISGGYSKECTIIHAPPHCRIIDSTGQPVPVKKHDHRITFDLKWNEHYRLIVNDD